MANYTRDIWVAGYPNHYGGAGPELDHHLDLWTQSGIEVHLVPNHRPSAESVAQLWARGIYTHEYRPDVFRNKLVVSFCNEAFLRRLPEISAEGKPRCVVWANCMTWILPEELQCHAEGLIDCFIFQTDYQRQWLLPELEQVATVHQLPGYIPYFSLERWKSVGGRWASPPSDVGFYAVGRVTRDDATKFPSDLWWTLDNVQSPLPVLCVILGWGENALGKCGPPPSNSDIDVVLLPPGEPPAPVFRNLHVLLHQTDTFRENLPRVALEAWASGVVLLAERDYGWSEIVDDGEDGVLCGSSDEFAFRASELAFDESRRQRLTSAAFAKLKERYGNPVAAFTPWSELV